MTVPEHPLCGRPLAIATMHGKEAVLVPPLVRVLGVAPVVPTGFDTDAFGTFTGDIARVGTALDTARRKARAAMARCGLTTAVASEGSFGPHPGVPLLPMAAELVLLLDDELGIEVIAEDVGIETNFAGQDVTDVAAARVFAARVHFPSHQLVLLVDGVPGATVRGIGDADRLGAEVERLLRAHGRVRVQSDMRADRNPTRMRAIARAAERLAVRAGTLCTHCGWPGYGLVGTERGLPCADCGEPSSLVRVERLGCARCGTHTERPRSDGRTHCDPGECEWCNP